MCLVRYNFPDPSFVLCASVPLLLFSELSFDRRRLCCCWVCLHDQNGTRSLIDVVVVDNVAVALAGSVWISCSVLLPLCVRFCDCPFECVI